MEHVPQGVTMSQENLLEDVMRFLPGKERMLSMNIYLMTFHVEERSKTSRGKKKAQWMEV